MSTATVLKLNREQTDLLESLGLPTVLSSEMTDSEFNKIAQRLIDEIQLRGLNGDLEGEHDYGQLCSSIYDALEFID